MTSAIWPRRDLGGVLARRTRVIDPEVAARAAAIVEDVRLEGAAAVRRHAMELDGLDPGQPLYVDRDELERQLAAVPLETRRVLERTAARIRTFAEAQRQALAELTVMIAGGAAGHVIEPACAAGCYAPGGRYPLPSSVLMTAIPARVAEVEAVWVASPRPAPITLAAAAVAGADGLLAVGGAQAVAGLAFGVGDVPSCDIIVGPGNIYVTAAKHAVSAHTGIDMLAGPTELVVLADDSADPRLVAADLLAQAEHDQLAVPILVTWWQPLVEAVERELEGQLRDLTTGETARLALRNGGAIVCATVEDAVRTCNALAPEHLQLMIREADRLISQLKRYGALFVGHRTAEVFGDYGGGPNHVLPTGGSARVTGGLSVLTFLRVRTWMRLDDLAEARELVADSVSLARLEGLEAHARAADLRRVLG